MIEQILRLLTCLPFLPRSLSPPPPPTHSQLSKKATVSGWGKSFFAVAEALQAKSDAAAAHDRRHFLLTPVVGPEAVQGSTRLKGGSATKILLETLLGMAASQVLKLPLLGGPAVSEKVKRAGRGGGR